MELHIRFRKLTENAIVPVYATPDAAGADLYALPTEQTLIPKGETRLIHTGIALEIPKGYGGFIYARSGLATKKGLAPANKVGVIDADYRGEIMVALHNHSEEDVLLAGGERVAQIVFAPVLSAIFTETDNLSETERAEGGFGSTGTR
ncbi:MAG: dUTP diphosphatase [Clostridia bacterium]|nr:dUTP diphosphatase [Clostridia bacterium]